MHIEENGNKRGEVVLFIHGLGQSSRLWTNHFKEMKNFHCLALDLPGHGKSKKVSWTTIDKVSDDIYDLLVRKKIKKINLVGLSLGGNIILDFISKHGEMVKSAIVDGSGVYPVKPVTAVRIAAAAVSPFLKNPAITKFVADSLGINNEEIYKTFSKDLPKTDPIAFRNALAQANEQLEPEGLKKIKTRILLVTGEKDLTRVVDSNKHLTKIILNAENYVVKNDGHGWMIRNADLHIRLTKAWIKKRKLPKEFEKVRT